MKKYKDLVSVHSEEQLYDSFIRFYDYKSWISKARILELIIEEKFSEIFDDIVLKHIDKEEILKSLKFELYMTKFHITEVLFALIFAFTLERKSPWLWLASYESDDLNKLISKVEDSKFWGVSKYGEDYLLGYLFYPVDIESHQKKEEIKKSIKFVSRFLKILAHEYEDRRDYNSYKHGFRALNVKSSIKITNEKTGKYLLDTSTDASLFLDVKPTTIQGKEMNRLLLVTKAFDYKRSIRIIGIAVSLIGNLIEARKSELDRKEFKMTLFHNRSIEEIFKFDAKKSIVTKFEI